MNFTPKASLIFSMCWTLNGPSILPRTSLWKAKKPFHRIWLRSTKRSAEVGKRKPRLHKPARASNRNFFHFEVEAIKRKEIYECERTNESGPVSSTDRTAQGVDYEISVLFYASAIWESVNAAESAFGAAADRVWSLLWEDRQTR